MRVTFKIKIYRNVILKNATKLNYDFLSSAKQDNTFLKSRETLKPTNQHSYLHHNESLFHVLMRHEYIVVVFFNLGDYIFLFYISSETYSAEIY